MNKSLGGGSQRYERGGRVAHSGRGGPLSERLAGRKESLLSRIARHDQELLRLRHEIRGAKKGSGGEKFYQRRAVQVLKQKRVMEKRLQNVMNMEFNVENMGDFREEGEMMRELEGVNGGVSRGVDDGVVEGLFEEIGEAVAEVEEVGRLFAADVSGELVDEAELERELEEEVRRERERDGRVASGSGESGETEQGLMEFIRRLEEGVPQPNDEVPGGVGEGGGAGRKNKKRNGGGRGGRRAERGR